MSTPIGWLNYFMAGASVQLGHLIGLLPSSPFTVSGTAISGVATFVAYAAYFLPIHETVTLLSALVPAIIVYYVIRIVLRWLKVVSEG